MKFFKFKEGPGPLYCQLWQKALKAFRISLFSVLISFKYSAFLYVFLKNDSRAKRNPVSVGSRSGWPVANTIIKMEKGISKMPLIHFCNENENGFSSIPWSTYANALHHFYRCLLFIQLLLGHIFLYKKLIIIMQGKVYQCQLPQTQITDFQEKPK